MAYLRARCRDNPDLPGLGRGEGTLRVPMEARQMEENYPKEILLLLPSLLRSSPPATQGVKWEMAWKQLPKSLPQDWYHPALGLHAALCTGYSTYRVQE